MPEETMIKISGIKWDYWPRLEPNQHQIDLYRAALEKLPPILINKNGFGIDGYHRCQAYRQEGKDEIPVEIQDIPDDDVLVESIKRNASWGLQLSSADKKSLACLLYAVEEDGEWIELRKISEVASILSVTPKTAERATKNIRDQMRTTEDIKIWDMWLACATQEEIANVVGQSRESIKKRLGTLRQMSESTKPDPLKMYNIWNFIKADKQFGIKYPGQIPGQIVEHLLYYYTDPFDVVWDLFGGGGITVDACRLHSRRYRVFDIRPIRDSIIEHDIADGIPELTPKPRLIFLDPPYWHQKKGEYGDQPTNFANLDINEFHDALENVIRASIKVAEFVALIISPTQYDWEFRDHAAEMIKRIGVPFHRISVPYSTEIHGGNYVKMAKENKQWLYLNRDLMIWRAEHGKKESGEAQK